MLPVEMSGDDTKFSMQLLILNLQWWTYISGIVPISMWHGSGMYSNKSNSSLIICLLFATCVAKIFQRIDMQNICIIKISQKSH